jgi:hypothetical protein
VFCQQPTCSERCSSSGHSTVVAVDASQGALKAVQWAATHACGKGDVLHLVHSYQPIHAIVGPQFEYNPTGALFVRLVLAHTKHGTQASRSIRG